MGCVWDGEACAGEDTLRCSKLILWMPTWDARCFGFVVECAALRVAEGEGLGRGGGAGCRQEGPGERPTTSGVKIAVSTTGLLTVIPLFNTISTRDEYHEYHNRLYPVTGSWVSGLRKHGKGEFFLWMALSFCVG